ncbi:PREDICTED: uncharacterized protein LOC105454557 isoform X2 [Wasmannia auropunctata]|uniref:uncharacterized protein LOC105454557 isoform X2 n=1 Tax=Wasmannia auropunctata TaxID=64793 RepID=UPI0005EE5289|nr:PREDICTED: uncharacterized protein LOC105454557 isoform X2 [Wasmannia auropunctata]
MEMARMLCRPVHSVDTDWSRIGRREQSPFRDLGYYNVLLSQLSQLRELQREAWEAEQDLLLGTFDFPSRIEPRVARSRADDSRADDSRAGARQNEHPSHHQDFENQINAGVEILGRELQRPLDTSGRDTNVPLQSQLQPQLQSQTPTSEARPDQTSNEAAREDQQRGAVLESKTDCLTRGLDNEMLAVSEWKQELFELPERDLLLSQSDLDSMWGDQYAKDISLQISENPDLEFDFRDIFTKYEYRNVLLSDSALGTLRPFSREVQSQRAPAPNTANRSLLRSQQSANGALPSAHSNDYLTNLWDGEEEMPQDEPGTRRTTIQDDLLSWGLPESLTTLRDSDFESGTDEETEASDWHEGSENVTSDQSGERLRMDNSPRSSLSDHTYHQVNAPDDEEPEESDSDEDIDVESITPRQERPAANYNFARRQPTASQRTSTSTRARQIANVNGAATTSTAVRRPRGRPPGPNALKRKSSADQPQPGPSQSGSSQPSPSAPKRARVQNCHQAIQPTNPRSSTSRDLEDTDRRRLHNDMERQRRISMKNLYETLRVHVPEIAGNDKASKVCILKQAKACIMTLNKDYSRLDSRREMLKKQQKLLQERLEQARRRKNGRV